MCGIVGYVGGRQAIPVLLNTLKRLEYRGYDSAGLAIINDDVIALKKQAGKVSALTDALANSWSDSSQQNATCGIAHTRWATHGTPSTQNAHPHLDQSGKIALVHNGIIENYRDIQKYLEDNGHKFYSETDSEILAHLIGRFYTETNDLLEATSAALRRVEGTFGIAVVSANHPGQLVVARRGSPIVIGVSKDETIAASDAAAIVSFTQRVIYLNDNDVALITSDSVDICDLKNVPVRRETSTLDWVVGSAEKEGFQHFMLKEIYEQPEALRNTQRGRLDVENGTAVLSGLNLSPHEIADLSRILMVACGTSLNAGLVGQYVFEDLAHIPARVEQAAEFRYRNPIILAGDLVLAISQSGETADTLAAIREAQRKGALVAGICNVVGSTVARETGRGVYIHAGPEISVASTKAFTCQVSVLLMLALKIARCGRLSQSEGRLLAEEMVKLPDIVEATLDQNDAIAKIAERYAGYEDVFFIGRGYMFPVAMEGALKLKEVSYIHAEGYHSAEMKHGPIALLQKNTPVVALLPDTPDKKKTLANAHECKARNAPVLTVTTKNDEEASQVGDDTITVPPCHPYLAAVPVAVALQLFAYHVAKLRGCEIDQPRNLAKSVTVE